MRLAAVLSAVLAALPATAGPAPNFPASMADLGVDQAKVEGAIARGADVVKTPGGNPGEAVKPRGNTTTKKKLTRRGKG
jgi:hypothetical protein